MFSVCSKAVKSVEKPRVVNQTSASLKKAKRKKQKKGKRRYFEHDTRTSVDEHVANVNKIKLNNKISIYGANASASATVRCAKRNLAKKLRLKQQSAASTKQLQLQLIQTQKELQRQLREMQEQQKQSMISLMCAKCNDSPNRISSTSNQCPSKHMRNSCKNLASHHLSNAIDSSLISKKCTTHKSKSADGSKATIR